jgi:SagB-type dehydrogenase family enzyme
MNEVKLPEPKQKGSTSIEEALNQRRSVRDYRRSPLGLEQVSQLLWAASGRNLYGRTAPSAGGIYPLEIYLVAGEVEGLAPGLYHYVYSSHSLARTKDHDIRSKLSRAALGQRMVEKGAINIIIAAAYGRTTSHYGQRGIRYVHMEAGHVGQSVSLQAGALSLGTVMIDAFEDEEVKEILAIEEDPLYIIPVGKM